MKVEDVFATKKNAIQALANVYSFLPHIDATHASTWMLGDEYIGSSALGYDDKEDKLRAIRIMRGLQVSGNNVILGQWSGTGGAKPLYQGINQANIFLANIDNVPDMDEVTIKDWKAQVKFLKAYFHFLLVQSYGPIVISDNVISPEETSEELLFPKRQKIDTCFNYIIKWMNEAIPDLRLVTSETDLGQVNKPAAAAIKARVMVTRARPFFNGSGKDIFGDFYDFDGEHYFPQDEKKEKWQDAITAINEALKICDDAQLGIYYYPPTKNIPTYDLDDWDIASDRMQTLYNLRYMPVDPWNNEIIWGYSNFEQFTWYDNYERWLDIQSAALPKLPPKPIYAGEGEFEAKGNVFGSGNWLAANYRMAERFYTKNGLPIEYDVNFDYGNRYDIVTTPGVTDEEYADIAGIMQPGIETIKLHLDREPRFYTSLAVSGSYFRAQRYRINALMFSGQDCGQGIGQRSDECFYITGIGVQKFTHPQTSGGWSFRTMYFPYPIIRMADLYLMKAEALNEFSGPSQDVWDALNVVRSRAGIPDVEDVWSKSEFTSEVGRHEDPIGMREIILEERAVELAFEGSRYWDIVGYKLAVTEFSKPVLGWNDRGTNARTFFNLESKQVRKFTPTNYLWPIDLKEMNVNSNLKQNPGW
jgi:hypothetical protein